MHVLSVLVEHATINNASNLYSLFSQMQMCAQFTYSVGQNDRNPSRPGNLADLM